MDFETAFSGFLETNEYDAAEQALLHITREAFRAGWKAAIKNESTNNIIDIKAIKTK